MTETATTSPDDSSQRPLALVAYDGSADARRAIAVAARLFPTHHAVIVTAWVSLPDASPGLTLAPGGVVMAAASALSDVLGERAEETAAEGARLATQAGLGAEARVIRSGEAEWEAIVRGADECDASVIVIGSRGRSAIAAAMLGSVSTGVVHHSSRPVLVVPRPEGA